MNDIFEPPSRPLCGLSGAGIWTMAGRAGYPLTVLSGTGRNPGRTSNETFTNSLLFSAAILRPEWWPHRARGDTSSSWRAAIVDVVGCAARLGAGALPGESLMSSGNYLPFTYPGVLPARAVEVQSVCHSELPCSPVGWHTPCRDNPPQGPARWPARPRLPGLPVGTGAGFAFRALSVSADQARPNPLSLQRQPRSRSHHTPHIPTATSRCVVANSTDEPSAPPVSRSLTSCRRRATRAKRRSRPPSGNKNHWGIWAVRTTSRNLHAPKAESRPTRGPETRSQEEEYQRRVICCNQPPLSSPNDSFTAQLHRTPLLSFSLPLNWCSFARSLFLADWNESCSQHSPLAGAQGERPINSVNTLHRSDLRRRDAQR